MQRGVVQADFRLNSGNGNDAESGSCPKRIIHQGALAHSMTAAEHKHAAETSPDVVQKVSHAGQLVGPIQQESFRTLPSAWRESLAA